jgi:ribonuclease P protein component
LIASIHGRHAFATLRRDGRRIRRSSLWCNWCPEPNSEQTRVAFAIGRACGSAVRRNRLRRRLRAIVRAIDREHPLPAGMMLVGARPLALELTFEELTAEMEDLITAVRS